MEELLNDLNVKILKGVVRYDDTSPVTVFSIPANAFVVVAMVRIRTAFAGTSPTVDFGDEDTADGFVPNTSVTQGTAGFYPGDGELTEMGSYLYDATKKSVYKFYPAAKDAIVTIGGTSLTAGIAEVYLIYFDLNPKIAEQGEY